MARDEEEYREMLTEFELDVWDDIGILNNTKYRHQPLGFPRPLFMLRKKYINDYWKKYFEE